MYKFCFYYFDRPCAERVFHKKLKKKVLANIVSYFGLNLGDRFIIWIAKKQSYLECFNN